MIVHRSKVITKFKQKRRWVKKFEATQLIIGEGDDERLTGVCEVEAKLFFDTNKQLLDLNNEVDYLEDDYKRAVRQEENEILS